MRNALWCKMWWRGSHYNYYVNGAWSQAFWPWHLVAALAFLHNEAHGHARTDPVYVGSVRSVCLPSPASLRKECVYLGLKPSPREQHSSLDTECLEWLFCQVICQKTVGKNRGLGDLHETHDVEISLLRYSSLVGVVKMVWFLVPSSYDQTLDTLVRKCPS